MARGMRGMLMLRSIPSIAVRRLPVVFWPAIYVDLANHGLRRSVPSNPVDPIQPQGDRSEHSVPIALYAIADETACSSLTNTIYQRAMFNLIITGARLPMTLPFPGQGDSVPNGQHHRFDPGIVRDALVKSVDRFIGFGLWLEHAAAPENVVGHEKTSWQDLRNAGVP